MTCLQLDFRSLITNLQAHSFSQLSIFFAVHLPNLYFISSGILWETVWKSLLKLRQRTSTALPALEVSVDYLLLLKTTGSTIIFHQGLQIFFKELSSENHWRGKLLILKGRSQNTREHNQLFPQLITAWYFLIDNNNIILRWPQISKIIDIFI